MNLPKTGFPMRAGLSKSEPKRLKDWQDNKVYEQVLKKNEGHKKFVLHDGPPYANGPIHIGHAMNKISKDMINRYWMMQGYEVPYVPGWDCHGQPIEHKVEEKLGTEKFNQTSTAKIRELCNKFAVENIELQKAGFRRLGVLGDWDNPYLTLYHQHDAADIEVFKAMFDKGMIYRGHKPVHWCKHCHTALAEAEIEYSDETSPSIFVRFEMTSKPVGLENFDGPVDFIIWTTTPWTIPSDQAVSLKPGAAYVAVEHDDRAEVMLEDLAPKCCEEFGWEYTPVVVDGKPYVVPAETFHHIHYKQPIFDGVEGVALLADYVGVDDGTGIVHNSPGHGVDDYFACLPTRPTRTSSSSCASAAPWSSRRRSRTAIRTAGAASTRCSSVLPTSGLSRWTRPVCASRLAKRSARTSSGIRPTRQTASAPWSSSVPTGASAVSATGACLSPATPAPTAARRS